MDDENGGPLAVAGLADDVMMMEHDMDGVNAGRGTSGGRAIGGMAAVAVGVVALVGGACAVTVLAVPPGKPVGSDNPLRTREAPEVAERAESGLSLLVPPSQAQRGTVFHVINTTGEAQVTFLSDTPIETIKGRSSGVIGYAVAKVPMTAEEGGDKPSPLLLDGQWVLPISTMKTGNAIRDQHMGEERWLDSASHPDIVFTLTRVKDAKKIKPKDDEGKGSAFLTYTCTLVGLMTVKGTTLEVSIPSATVSYRRDVPGAEVGSTEEIGVEGAVPAALPTKGSLLALRCKYSIRLSDYGISNDVIVESKKVAEVVEIDQTLVMSTVPPEQQAKSEAAKPADGRMIK